MNPAHPTIQPEPEAQSGFDLLCACKLGRLLGGHDPITSVRQFAPTLDHVVKTTAKRMIEKHGGDYRAAAKALGVNHGTLYRWFPTPKNIVRLAACLCVVALVGCATAPVFSEPPQIKAATGLPPLPVATASTARSVVSASYSNFTNGVTWLEWNPGLAPQTLVNLTNQSAVAVGDASLARASGLAAKSVNAFVVTNADGTSNVAVGVAEVETNRITEIGQIYSVPLYVGRTNYLVTSTNLVTWSIEKLLGTNGTSVFLVTNIGPAKFYRVKAL